MFQDYYTLFFCSQMKEFLKQNSNFIGNYSEQKISEREEFLSILHDKISVARTFFEENLQ